VARGKKISEGSGGTQPQVKTLHHQSLELPNKKERKNQSSTQCRYAKNGGISRWWESGHCQVKKRKKLLAARRLNLTESQQRHSRTGENTEGKKVWWEGG